MSSAILFLVYVLAGGVIAALLITLLAHFTGPDHPLQN
jgi:hypothetical protein